MCMKMNKLKVVLSAVLITLFCLSESNAQIGLGRVTGLDFYQYYRVPDYGNTTGHSSGSAVANIVLGPKLWVGGKSFSVSAEGALSFAPFAFNTAGHKGLGAINIPVSVDLNFMGLSGFSVEAKQGFSVGAGMSFNRTELYFVKDEYAEVRDKGFYRIYFGQIGYGVGSGGNDLKLYLRYGRGDNSASHISTGILMSTNYFTGKKTPLGK